MVGMGEILVIGSALVIYFCARRLPDAVKSVKKSVQAFKGGLKEDDTERPVRDVNSQSGSQGPKHRD